MQPDMDGEDSYMHDEEDSAEQGARFEGDVDEAELDRKVPVESWRQAARALSEAGSKLNAEEDFAHHQGAAEAVEARMSERQAETDRLRNETAARQAMLTPSALAKIYAQASAAARRPAGIPTEPEHHAAVRELERQQYSVNKALNEEQSAAGKKEVELGRLRSEKEETARWNVGSDEISDPQVIKLKLLSEMGFSLLPTAQNEPIKLVVRNDSKSDMHPVTIDHTRSKAHYANLLWSLAGE